MFEKHKEKKAAEQYRSALATWQEAHDSCVHALQLAQSFAGEGDESLMLKPGEAVFGKVTQCGLVEERRGPGHYQGAYSGFSIPVGTVHGRTVRYHIGGTRGHYVQGTPVPTAIDTGTAIITNKRVIFQGNRQTRECLFDKLIGSERADGSTTFSVSNRQKPITIHYGNQLSGWFDLHLDLALAHYRDEVPALTSRLQQDLIDVDSHKPSPPVGYQGGDG